MSTFQSLVLQALALILAHVAQGNMTTVEKELILTLYKESDTRQL